MKRILLAAAVSSTLALGATGAIAQPGETEAPFLVAAAAAGEASGAPQGAPERRAFRSAAERVEARLAYIQTALQITSAQQPQWEGLAGVMRKHAREIDERMQQRRAQAQQGAPQTLNAIERLERTQQRTAARYHRLGELITAAKPLYAVLTPEQKQAADEMLARGGHGGHGGHHRRFHGGHRGA